MSRNLVIGVRKGNTFWCDHTPVKVRELNGWISAVLEVKGERITVYDDKQVEILPGVFVSCGKPSDEILERAAAVAAQRQGTTGVVDNDYYSGLIARLNIDAPEDVKVLRNKLYEQAYGRPQTRNQNSVGRAA